PVGYPGGAATWDESSSSFWKRGRASWRSSVDDGSSAGVVPTSDWYAARYASTRPMSCDRPSRIDSVIALKRMSGSLDSAIGLPCIVEPSIWTEYSPEWVPPRY